MIKMIVFDLDGTLIDKDKKVSKDTINYFTELKRKGYIIVSASGRILSSQKEVASNLSFVDYAITGSGSECYELRSDKTIFDSPIDINIAKRIIPYFNQDCRYIDICDKNTIYSYSNIEKHEDYIKCTKNWNYIFNNVGKIYHLAISMNSNDNIDELYDNLVNDMPELSVNIMQDSFSTKKWIEINQKDCSKYNAIKKLANYLNINNDEIIAFGDGLNDIDMIKKCGIGVAMNNALDEVKKCADYITKENYNNDGLIKFLKEFLDV